MDISRALNSIQGSATAQIFAKAQSLQQEGKDIIHLEIGQPDFGPPDIVIEATIQALRDSKTAYTVSRGIEELRQAIGEFHLAEDGAKLNHKSEIIITSGAKLAIFGAVWSVTDPGDNVIVLNPSWVSYGDIIESLGGEVRYLPVDLEFDFDKSKLDELTDDRTAAVIVNSPSNPTGAIISVENLQTLADHCRRHDLLLISDEIYSDYIYEGQHNTLLAIDDWKEIGVVVNGFSKTFSMTGFRLGYAMSNSLIITQMNKVMQLTASCATSFSQYAAVTAIKNIDQMREFIHDTMFERRAKTIELLQDMGVEFKAPQGAIYAWFRIPSEDSTTWATELLEDQGVALTPGRAFGPDGEGFVRICFAVPIPTLESGLSRIAAFLNR